MRGYPQWELLYAWNVEPETYRQSPSQEESCGSEPVPEKAKHFLVKFFSSEDRKNDKGLPEQPSREKWWK